VNPSEWRERTSMTINVGLGAGERDRLAQAMGMVLSTHQQVIANGGEGVLVSLKNIYRAAIDLAKYSGIKNAEWYYTDPESEEAQQAMQLKQQQAEEAKQNDPARLLVQVEAEKKQVTALKNQLEHQRKAFELQQKMAEMAAAHQVEIQKLKQDYNAKISEQAIKLTELELKYTQNVPGSVV
jgi:exonuclease VII large subunit